MTVTLTFQGDGSWEQTASSTKGTVTEMKGTSDVDVNTDGTYTLTVTHYQQSMSDGTYDEKDPTTWGNLVEVSAGLHLSIEIKDSGKTLEFNGNTLRRI